MLKFLIKTKQGVNLNLIAYLLPTHVYRSDSCPIGLRGYAHLGWTWRFRIPPHLFFRASNNLLEHMASIVTVLVEILAGRLKPGDCCLSMVDSSTSEGWTRRSNFSETREEPEQAVVRCEVAYDHTWHVLHAGVKDYSQQFPGAENNVADSLSRDFYLSDVELTNILTHISPQRLPQDVITAPLLNKIVSWLTLLLQKLPTKKQLHKGHTMSKLVRGHDVSSTASPSALMMSSSMGSLEDSASRSWEPLPWLSVTHGFHQTIMLPWLRQQSDMPSARYLRPSGRTTNLTRPRMMTTSLDAFYHGSTKLSKIRSKFGPTKGTSNRRPPQARQVDFHSDPASKHPAQH